MRSYFRPALMAGLSLATSTATLGCEQTPVAQAPQTETLVMIVIAVPQGTEVAAAHGGAVAGPDGTVKLFVRRDEGLITARAPDGKAIVTLSGPFINGQKYTMSFTVGQPATSIPGATTVSPVPPAAPLPAGQASAASAAAAAIRAGTTPVPPAPATPPTPATAPAPTASNNAATPAAAPPK